MYYISISNAHAAQGLPQIRISNGINDPEPIYCSYLEILGPSNVIAGRLVIPRFGVHTAIETEGPLRITK